MTTVARRQLGGWTHARCKAGPTWEQPRQNLSPDQISHSLQQLCRVAAAHISYSIENGPRALLPGTAGQGCLQNCT